MAIRRFHDHVAEHNWFAVMIDLGIVVVGVFLGIQASNWNADRVEREEGRTYRARLVDELEATERALGAMSAHAAAAKAYAARALAVATDPARPAGEPFLIDAYQASQIVNRPAMRTTYDEIIASGKLETIGPPELRARIAYYYWRVDGALSLDSGQAAYRDLLRTAMPNAVQEAIRARCDDDGVDIGKGLIVGRMPGRCEIGLDKAVAAREAQALRAWRGIASGLNRQMSLLDSRILSYRRLAANARDIREQILAADGKR